MRLLRRIFNGRFARRHGSRHHDVNGRPHGYHVQINMVAPQFLRFRNDKPVLNPDIGAKRPESLDVLVNGS